ncbi:MAG: polymerase sigma factor [Clostridia bacterium]|jgi:RNA polymerase sigma factor (sigma-70 family)|nr:polymerase sigma factor [Clostridia bacterium]
MNVQDELYYYTTYQSKLKQHTLELERLLREYQGVKGMAYDSVGGGGTNAINRAVENEVMIREVQINRLKAMIEEVQYRINIVDAALETLSDLEQRLVKCRYFKRFDLYQVSEILGYSYSGVRKLNTKTIDKLTHVLGR